MNLNCDKMRTPRRAEAKSHHPVDCELATAFAGCKELLAQSEFLDERGVICAASFCEISQKTIALADHQQKSTATRVILLVSLKVGLKRIDALSQNCDLNFSRSAIGCVLAMSRDDWCFFLCRDHCCLVFFRWTFVTNAYVCSLDLSIEEYQSQSKWSTVGKRGDVRTADNSSMNLLDLQLTSRLPTSNPDCDLSCGNEERCRRFARDN